MRRKLISHRFKRKTPEEDNTEIYHGLADAFGLESLMPYDEKQVPPLIMRASVYRHRHCMYFQVSLDESMVKRIKALMKKHACDEALKLIKEQAPIIHIPKEFLDSFQTRGLTPGRTIWDEWSSKKKPSMGVNLLFFQEHTLTAEFWL